MARVTPLTPEERKRKSERAKELYQENRARYLKYASDYRERDPEKTLSRAAESAKRCIARIRDAIFDRYGAACVRCGFSDKRALQFDHVNGGGSQDVLQFKSKWKYLRHILEDDTGKFQVLCANCNAIKRLENGEHRKSATYYSRLREHGAR